MGLKGGTMTGSNIPQKRGLGGELGAMLDSLAGCRLNASRGCVVTYDEHPQHGHHAPKHPLPGPHWGFGFSI